MEIKLKINGINKEITIKDGEYLQSALNRLGFLNVRKACETGSCGICTVLLDGVPTLSCSTLAIRGIGKEITTLEGESIEVAKFAEVLTSEGADQCGYCNPGFIMNVLAMVKELKEYTDEDIKEYLVGNLCRCTGYMGQFRAVRKFLDYKKGGLK